MGREFVKSEDVNMAVAFLVIQGLFAAIFGMAVEGKVASMLKETLGYFIGFMDTSIKMPYAKVFFGTLVISVILSVGLAALLLAANLIFKNQVTFKEMLCASAMRSICIMPVTVVALVLVLLNPAMGIVVFFSANIGAIIVISQVNPMRDENATNMLSLALYLALFIFMLVSCYLMYKASGIYVPEEVGEGITDLLSELM